MMKTILNAEPVEVPPSGERGGDPKSLRILMTVDPEIPVPPTHYGGIERIVDMLVRGLVSRGHEVTLLANPESQVPCKLMALPGQRSRVSEDLYRNTCFTSMQILKQRPDVVHSFGRLGYLLPVLPLPIPKVMSYQRIISPRSVQLGEKLSLGTLHFTGCSANLIDRFKSRKNWHVIYNAVPAGTYHFNAKVDHDAPLVFLGRIEEIKGPHLAIEVARRSGRRLVIAGNIPDEHRKFFERHVLPFVDGDRVRFTGPVGDIEKDRLLGQAAALLMPILWDEPFGIVMAEALACGTPVIGLNRGSVPEVVQDGRNGFVCESGAQMAGAVRQLGRIDRRQCRLTMEERFSDRCLIDAYEGLYRSIARKGRQS
jgi:glycosyltransferase involved in cell wall biosynthesis